MHHFLKFVLKNWQVEWTFCIEELAGFTNLTSVQSKFLALAFIKFLTKMGYEAFTKRISGCPKIFLVIPT